MVGHPYVDICSMYTHVSTSCKQLRCHYAAYCGLSVVCLVPFIGLRPHESSSLSRTARYTWLGRSRCSLCLVLLTACQLKLVASRSLTSSPSSLSLRSFVTPFPLSWLLVNVPNAPPHLTLIKNQSMKDFVNWLYSQLVIAAFAFVLLVVPQLIERLI